MVRYRTHLLAGVAVAAGLLAVLPIVQAVGRSNPRDFPDTVFCAFNLGFEVDSVTGAVTPVTRPSKLPFTAEKAKALITLVACDRGLVGNQLLDVAVRNFAVVRQDVYDSHQRANPNPDKFSCNISGLDDYSKTVGSVFDPKISPAVAVNSKFVPFFDDFSNLTASNRDWRLDGSTLETFASIQDPMEPVEFFSGNALVLARGFSDATRDLCTSASVKVGRLRIGERYVVDFRWSVSGIQNPPEVDMLTYVDTNPKE